MPKQLQIVVKKKRSPTKPAYLHRTHKKDDPFVAAPVHHTGELPAIDRALSALVGIGEVRDGRYLLDGHLVSLGTFLEAANDAIARRNGELPRDRQHPLIGTHHHRWGQ